MSTFYSGRHRAPQQPSTFRKAGLGVAAAATLGMAAPVVVATGGASAAPATTDAAETVRATAATATTTSFSDLVSYGDRGAVVRRIQRIVGTTADGIFGPATRSAVMRWQSRHDLVADGVVGPRTGSAMNLDGSSSRTPARSTSRSTTRSTNFSGLVSYGDRGSLVRQVQRIVGASADGIFGSGTRAAVMRWQSRHDLIADGVVGPRTGSAMGLSGSSSTDRASRDSSRTALGGSTSSSSLLGTAAGLVGTPYRYGGTTPRGFDCSGFTQYVFGQQGISLPRTAEAQRRATRRVSSPQPGDLVFFGSPAYHVGIYAGNGMMYDSGNSRVPVSKRAIWTSSVTYGRV